MEHEDPKNVNVLKANLVRRSASVLESKYRPKLETNRLTPLKSKFQTISHTLGFVTSLSQRVPLSSAAERVGRQSSNSSGHMGGNRKWRRGGSFPDEGDHHVPSRRQRSHDSESSEHERRKLTSKYRSRMKHLRGKFRATAKLCVMCSRLSKAHFLRNKLYDEISPYVTGLAFHDYEVATAGMELMFDPSRFKADKQLRISEETKKILIKSPYCRTDKELYTAQIALRNIKSIAEYPMRMQRLIVEVGYYQKYEAKRVVVRQGHSASAFYFILSGSVVVMVSDLETKVAKPVAYLYKGMTFGELAIINRTSRQSTVIAKETLELLSIDIEEFHRIFMSGGVKNINDPDHNEFIRSISFLNGWPVLRMAEHANKCIFHYYKRGDIIVKDSRYSDWLFIVKSGSIRVLKKLKRVEAFEWKKNKGNKSSDADEQNEDELVRKKQQRRYILSDIKIPLRTTEQHSTRITLPTISRTSYIGYDEGTLNKEIDTAPQETKRTDCANNTIKRKNGVVYYSTSLLPSHTGDKTDSTQMQNDTLQDDADGPPNEGSIRENVTGFDPRSLTSIPLMSSDYSRMTMITSRRASYSSTLGRVQSATVLKSKKEQERAEMEREMQGRKQEIRTITQDLDAAYQIKADDDLTEADRDPMFVHVQTLTKGQVFGIAETILGPQPSMCVVSNGAECIMLAKDLYLQHAPESLLRQVRQECCPYPSDLQMQDCLQASVDWEAYRISTFQDTLTSLKLRKSQERSQILTSVR